MSREMDAQIAEKVMGLNPCTFKGKGGISGLLTFWECECGGNSKCFPVNQEAVDHPHSPLDRYSTDIKAAFEVEDRIAAMGLAEKYAMILGQSAALMEAEFLYGEGSKPQSGELFWLVAHATPEQRCLAALKAVGEETAE